MNNDKIKEMLKYIYDRDYSISILAVTGSRTFALNSQISEWDDKVSEYLIEYGDLIDNRWRIEYDYHQGNTPSTYLCEYIDTVDVIKYEELLQIYRDKKLRKVLNER